jgi:O-antigen/teichoic acid export membrane protein
MPEETQKKEVRRTQSIGKGSLAIMFAQILFLGFNFILRTYLAHNISAAQLDIYHLVVSVLIMSFQRIIHYGLPVAVSKYLSQDPAYLGYFMTKGVRLQIAFSLILFVLAVAITPIIVVVVKSKAVVVPYLIGCLSIPFFAIYNIRLCILNGLRRFYQESITMTAFGLFRLLTVVLVIFVVARLGPGFTDMFKSGAEWGFNLVSLNGAILASTFAALLGLSIGWAFTREKFGYREDPNMLQDIIQFVSPNILSILLLHLLMNVDIFLVNRFFVNDLNQAGYYAQASFIAILPFILFNALYATIFPNIIYEISNGAVEKAKEIVMFSTRIVSITLIPMCLIVWASSSEIIDLFNPPEYLSASLALSILIVSISLFTLFMNLGVITVAGGHPKKFTSAFLITLPLGVIFNLVLIPFFAHVGLNFPNGQDYTIWLKMNGSEELISVSWALAGAAIAAGLTAIVGCLYLGFHVRKRFGGLFNYKTSIRALLASIPAYLVVRFVPFQGPMILVELLIATIIYSIAILAIGEFTKDEMTRIFGRFKKKDNTQ